MALGLLDSGCSPGKEEEPLRPDQVALPLESLTEGRRVIVVVAGNPVELVRTGDTVTARLLRCTHVGCVVRWKADERAYVCPCHEGRYDESGTVLAGPPPLPLRTLPVAVSRGRVVVG